MKLVSTLSVLLIVSSGAWAQIANPFTNTFRGGMASPVQSSSALPNFTSSNTVAAPQVLTNTVVQTQVPTTTTTTQVIQQPVASTGHTHPIPQFAPPPVVPGVSTHAHLGQNPAPPVPAPGMPHMHSGHPYIAPAVAPQRMTYQQIIEYLANTNGLNLASTLRNGSGNFLAQCKAYCDTLPPNPTCDSSNVLYRNECEAKCVHKTVSTSTLRYGMCCCSDDDFKYATAGNVFFSSTTGTNLCFSTCIFNCLGGETPIEAQHQSDNLVVALARSSTSCANIS